LVNKRLNFHISINDALHHIMAFASLNDIDFLLCDIDSLNSDLLGKGLTSMRQP